MKSHYSTQRHYLFCPGPVNVADNIKKAATLNEIGHREREFSELLHQLNFKLLQLYGQKTASNYRAVIITGSGTAANEAVLSSVIGKQKILVISNGEFGERLYAISKLHNKHTYTIAFKWGEILDLAKVEKYLKTHKIDAIAMVHHETSTGMINPVEAVGRLVKKYAKIFIVDTVSSAGAEYLDIEKANISFCTSSASKAIASLPGVSYVVGKISEFEKLKKIPPKTIFLNLYKFYTYAQTLEQTPNTPAVQSFFALNQALGNILTDGIHNRIAQLRSRAKYLRTEMKKMGLNFLIPENQMSCVLTTVNIPPYITSIELRNKLREKDIIIYNGKGPIENKVFQVGNIGYIEKSEIEFFIKSLKSTLKKAKRAYLRKSTNKKTVSTHSSYSAASATR